MIWPFRKRAPRAAADPPPAQGSVGGAGDAAAPWKAPSLEEALTLARSAGAEAVDAIPLLAPVLAYQRGDTNQRYPLSVMRELNESLDELVRRMTPGDCIRIGQRLRAPRLAEEGDARQGWVLLAVERLPDIVSGTPHDFARLAVLSSHRNGRIRERALLVLDEEHGDDALPFLLARCVDWVAKVREVAWASVRRRLVPASASHFVASLPLVLRLRDFRRVRCAPLVIEVLDFLSNQPDALKSGLEHSLPSVRHASWDAMDERDMLSATHALRAVRDSALARKAGRYLSAHAADASPPLRQRVVDALADSPAPELRLSSLLLAERSGLPDTTERLRRATLDPARSVRQHARYHLREAGVEMDHRRVYLDTLPRSLGAIAGLGEVGEPGDWEALVACLEERTRYACEAIRAMRTLSAAESREMRLFMVQEGGPKVSGVARMSVQGEIHEGDEEMIRACMESESLHVRRQGVRLASFLPGWRAPLLIAPFVTSETRRAAALALRRWRVRPGPSQAEFKAWREWMRATGVPEREAQKRAEWARFRFNIQT